MSSDYSEAGAHVYDIAEELRTNFAIQGDPYNNIVLDTTESGFTSAHDPKVLVERDAATLYWPGGSPVHGGHFETVAREGDAHQHETEASTIRRALLAASIGSGALERVPQDMRAAWEAIKDDLAPNPPILYAIRRCELLALPLAVCQTSTVVESQVAPVGMRMMHLWYPNYLSPRPVLAILKQVVRKANETETS